MSANHVSHPEIEKLARRELRPDEILAVTRHIGECEDCGRRAREAAARFAVKDVFALDDEVARLSKPSRSYYAYAAAAAIVIVAAALLLVRTPHRTRQIAATPPAAVRPSPSPEYERSEWSDAVHDAIRSGNIERPSILAELRPPNDMLRSNDQSRPVTMEPTGVIIETTRPLFSWTPFKGARYIVSIFDGNHEVIASSKITSPSWTPPTALPRDTRLTWQVEVSRDDSSEIIPAPPAPLAMFRITSEETERDLDEARRLHPNDHLLMGVLYARAGLQARAEEELGKAKTPAASRILSNLAAWK